MKITYAHLWVHDQDEARAFYTEKVGMEVQGDVVLEELEGFRWLVVGPPGQEDVGITLMAFPEVHPAFDAETLAQIKDLTAKGATASIFLTTDDCRRDYELLLSRGVEFTEPPSERPYGIDCGFRDPSGNHLRLTQPTEMDLG